MIHASPTRRSSDLNEDRIGMSLAPMAPEVRDQLGIDPAEGGVVIAGVEEGGPAAQAGLQPGDVITRVGPRPIERPEDVVAAIEEARKAGRESVDRKSTRLNSSH